MNRYIAIASIAIALTGCATEPVATSETKPVPVERMFSTAYTQPRSDSGVLLVKRDIGRTGSACKLRLLVNAQPIAELLPAERVELYLAAGDYVLSVDPNGRCEKGLAEVATTVRTGARTTFRIGYQESGELHISPTAF